MIMDSAIIAAQPGWSLVFNCYTKKGEPYCGYYLEPVIGWFVQVFDRVHDNGDQAKTVEPITACGTPNQLHAILKPSGEVEVIGLRTCENLAEYDRRSAANDW